MTKLALHQSRAHRRQIRAHALATAGTVPLAAAQLSQCLCPGVLAPARRGGTGVTLSLVGLHPVQTRFRDSTAGAALRAVCLGLTGAQGTMPSRPGPSVRRSREVR